MSTCCNFASVSLRFHYVEAPEKVTCLGEEHTSAGCGRRSQLVFPRAITRLDASHRRAKIWRDCCWTLALAVYLLSCTHPICTTRCCESRLHHFRAAAWALLCFCFHCVEASKLFQGQFTAIAPFPARSSFSTRRNCFTRPPYSRLPLFII